MNHFIELVGLPGSGKSTVAAKLKNHFESEGKIVRIFSSDATRAALYGDENIQGEAKTVFDLLDKELCDFLDANDNVVAIYDATNLIAKTRKALINRIKRLRCVCYYDCIFVACRLSECKKRQFSRDRQVPEEVIERMVRSFQAPWFNEGWDDIRIIEGGALYDISEEHLDAWDVSHDNHHHQLSIGKHMSAARLEAIKLVEELGYGKAAIEAAYHHDIGKPHTKSFTNMKGEATDEAHFYSHESVSSYMWLSCYHPVDLTQSDILTIAALIQWHMMPYFLIPTQGVTRHEALMDWGYKKGFTEQFLELLWVVHQADQAAH